jgi:hypothetical protein
MQSTGAHVAPVILLGPIVAQSATTTVPAPTAVYVSSRQSLRGPMGSRSSRRTHFARRPSTATVRFWSPATCPSTSGLLDFPAGDRVRAAIAGLIVSRYTRAEGCPVAVRTRFVVKLKD